MLNFDEDRFLSIQSGAVGLAAAIDAEIEECLAGGTTNVVFAGAGGAGILMWPAAELLARRSSLPTRVALPAEMVLTEPAWLGPGTLLVIPSRSGNTVESIAALEYAQARGARVLTLVANEGTPLADRADRTFINFAADDTSSESFYVQSLLVALSVMRHRGEIDDYDEIVAQLELLPRALLEAKRAFEPRAASLAAEIKDEDYHVFTGAGSAWPEAFYFAMCILEEMQWIRTRPVHASDFFHGTLELLEPGVSLFLLAGEDELSPLADRVAAFVPERTDRFRVVDTRDFELAGLSPRVRSLVSSAVLATVLERLSVHLEVLRGHPLTTRRYYRQFSY